MKNSSKILGLMALSMSFEISLLADAPAARDSYSAFDFNVGFNSYVADAMTKLGVTIATRDASSTPTPVTTMEQLIGSTTATADDIKTAILAVTATSDVSLLAVRNSINTLISQVYYNWIAAMDAARTNSDVTLLDDVENTFKPAAQAFALALNGDTGFAQYQDLVNQLAQAYSLMLGAAAVYEIFVADVKVKALISKNAQSEANLSVAVDAAKQEISMALAVLTTSNVVQTKKDGRLTTALGTVQEQRATASSIIGAAVLGNA